MCVRRGAFVPLQVHHRRRVPRLNSRRSRIIRRLAMTDAHADCRRFRDVVAAGSRCHCRRRNNFLRADSSYVLIKSRGMVHANQR